MANKLVITLTSLWVLFLFRPLKMGRNFVFVRVCVIVFFCFARKVRYNDRTGLRNILYLNPFIRDSNVIKKFQKFFPVEKNRVEIFDFSSNFERVSRLTLACLCLI